MKVVFLIFLFVLIFQACRDGQTSVFCGEYVIVNDFPIIQTPQSEKLDIEIMGLNQLYVVDTFLIAFKASGHNDFFEIYSTNDFRYLGHYLSKGRGPNEFLSVQYYDNYYQKNDDIILWISDHALQKKAQFNLTQSVKQQKTVCDTIFRFSCSLSSSYQNINMNDSIVVITYHVPGNIKYLVENSRTHQVISEGEFLKSNLPQRVDDCILNMLMVKHPERELIACFPMCFNQINLFSPKLGECSSISYQLPVDRFKVANQPDSLLVAYYSTFSPTSQNVYALYVNQQQKKYPYWDLPIEIHEYDWCGKPVSKICLPNNIVYFAVDEKHQCIYAMNAVEEIFRYKVIEI